MLDSTVLVCWIAWVYGLWFLVLVFANCVCSNRVVVCVCVYNIWMYWPSAMCNFAYGHIVLANYGQRLICGLDYKPQGHLSSNIIIGFCERTNVCNWFFVRNINTRTKPSLTHIIFSEKISSVVGLLQFYCLCEYSLWNRFI